MRRLSLFCLIIMILMMPGTIRAAAVRPGDTPPPAKLELRMNAGFIFPSALSSCEAGIENPEDSGLMLRYTLTIEPGELARASGMRLEKSEPILLYRSELIAPGEKIDAFRLNALPGGTLLPVGEYQAVMTVTPLDKQGRPALNGEFAVQVFVRVMASDLEARADEAGMLDLRLYNGRISTERYALIVKAKDLGRPHGIDVSDLGMEHSFAIIALSDELAPMQETFLRLRLLPDGTALRTGRYEAWLIRLRQGEAAYAESRVLLEVPDTVTPLSQSPVLPAAMKELAQAVVNAEHLLNMR